MDAFELHDAKLLKQLRNRFGASRQGEMLEFRKLPSVLKKRLASIVGAVEGESGELGPQCREFAVEIENCEMLKARE